MQLQVCEVEEKGGNTRACVHLIGRAGRGMAWCHDAMGA
jgi:hypothetical protein